MVRYRKSWYLSRSGCGIKSGIHTTFLARSCGSTVRLRSRRIHAESRQARIGQVAHSTLPLLPRQQRALEWLLDRCLGTQVSEVTYLDTSTNFARCISPPPALLSVLTRRNAIRARRVALALYLKAAWVLEVHGKLTRATARCTCLELARMLTGRAHEAPGPA